MSTSAFTLAASPRQTTPKIAAPARPPARVPVGNQALLRRLQPKLVVGAIDDPLEAEADKVADTVMRMPEPMPVLQAAPLQLSRNCAGCEEEDKQKLQKKSAPPVSPQIAPPIVHQVLHSPGEPLDGATRAFFEPRFNRDFSQVRIHNDEKADASARSVGALAYTVGSHIVFSAGQRPSRGQHANRLLAHELAHVIQQRARVGVIQRQGDQPRDGAPAASAQQDAAQSAQTGPDSGTTGSTSPDAAHPELSSLVAKVEELKAIVADVARDQTPAARTETGGATWCPIDDNADLGKPKTLIDRAATPTCLVPCVEVHEQTHAEFMAQPCEQLGLAFGRIYFWMHVAKQSFQAGQPAEAQRALDNANTATEEARKTVVWYNNYMNQTCRFDEGNAYAAGIKACETDDAQKRCAAAGQTADYQKQMAAWKRFMQDPPNCPATKAAPAPAAPSKPAPAPTPPPANPAPRGTGP